MKVIEIELQEDGWRASETLSAIAAGHGELVSLSGGTVIRKAEATEGDEPAIVFIDGWTGEIRQRLTGEPYRYWTLSGFLSDDRVALFDSKNLQLNIFDTDGNVIQRIDVPQKPQSNFVLVDPETIVFTVVSNHSDESLELRGIDLETGQVRKVGSDLRPVAAWLRVHYWVSERMITPEPASPITKLFYDRNGSLVFFDPSTGERETILELSHQAAKE